MFVIGQFLVAVAKLLNYVIEIYIWVIIIYAVLGWFRVSPYHPIMNILRALVIPIFRPIRKLFRPFVGPVDLTPLIAILLLWFLQLFLVPVIYRIGVNLL